LLGWESGLEKGDHASQGLYLVVEGGDFGGRTGVAGEAGGAIEDLARGY